MARVGHGIVEQICLNLKSPKIEICVHRNPYSFSVSAWVFPGVSIFYVEKAEEVEVWWRVLILL